MCVENMGVDGQFYICDGCERADKEEAPFIFRCRQGDTGMRIALRG